MSSMTSKSNFRKTKAGSYVARYYNRSAVVDSIPGSGSLPDAWIWTGNYAGSEVRDDRLFDSKDEAQRIALAWMVDPSSVSVRR